MPEIVVGGVVCAVFHDFKVYTEQVGAILRKGGLTTSMLMDWVASLKPQRCVTFWIPPRLRRDITVRSDTHSVTLKSAYPARIDLTPDGSIWVPIIFTPTTKETPWNAKSSGHARHV